MWVSNVSARIGGGGLANEMGSHASSERVQAGVGHEGRGTRFQSRVVLTKKENLRQSLLTLRIL